MMKDPSDFFAALKQQKYKLKGVGEISYHLGGDFFCDPDGTLAWEAKTYCKRVVQQCISIFGAPPKEYTSPTIDQNDQPELDMTDEASSDEIKQYQTLIGCFQWAISLGRYDIFCATMSMGRFCLAPKVGHLKHPLIHICGYFKKYPDDATIRFRTEIPDYSHIDHTAYDWSYSVYGKSTEELPFDMPTSRGKPVRTSIFEDANLMQDLTTGRSVTDILHLVNSAPADWFCKLQGNIETATYGSEFMASRLCH